ncbi:hypothetical protein CO657_35955 (plasmid) [Rhizobium acidisoli]|uniref:Uncharacterized protein n=1 Tax=Rhizobium acidisoli TaxID=1538158 RepID=A0AAE5WVB7_9HYPH|nr:hypothetical protein [Rhizobium acidisoli]KPH05081.1 hypothetical protein AOG23_29570 [Rhizobium acidisoli]QAS83170.1 hypothetical protein CO657_35955 [Rhizobium acidisoli]
MQVTSPVNNRWSFSISLLLLVGTFAAAVQSRENSASAQARYLLVPDLHLDAVEDQEPDNSEDWLSLIMAAV